jgi:sulfite oxidase
MPVQSTLFSDATRALSRDVSRRDFVRIVGASGAALGMGSNWLPLTRADDNDKLPPGNRLIVRSAKPLNAEPALDKLVSAWITPVEFFYIRNHGATPEIDVETFRISVKGMVDRPMQFSVAELVDRFPAAKAAVTLTCAGNRRSEFKGPKISGVAWGAGAIGNAAWSGVSLSALLRNAGVRDGARHVWFEGADEILDKSEKYLFGGSIPLEKALPAEDRSPGVLLATKMNDKPLAAEHGFPLRAVVPGFIGARSVKWLKKIIVSDQPSPNHYLTHAYKVIEEDSPAALATASPLYEYAVNSAIAVWSRVKADSPDRLEVRGYALPGGAAKRTLKRIEISPDGGESWTPAKITSPEKEFCWALWSAEVAVTKQTERLLVRATDSSGAIQPRETPWNVKGYQYNAWHEVRL